MEHQGSRGRACWARAPGILEGYSQGSLEDGEEESPGSWGQASSALSLIGWKRCWPVLVTCLQAEGREGQGGQTHQAKPMALQQPQLPLCARPWGQFPPRARGGFHRAIPKTRGACPTPQGAQYPSQTQNASIGHTPRMGRWTSINPN